MVAIESARRSLQACLVVREARAAGLPPRARIFDDRLANRAERVGARVPEARAHEHFAGRQVQIVAGGVGTSARYRSLFALNHSRLLWRESSARNPKTSRGTCAIRLRSRGV